MKSLIFFLGAVLIGFTSKAQEICMVSADYLDGEKYIVAWSKPFDPSLYDSVFIYRKQGVESVFSKIGSQSMSALSMYKDLTSSTMDTTKYKISFLDIAGNETALSPWHQASVLDYNSGTVWWTTYKKEDQIDYSYITSYECIRDQTGIGAYTTMGIWDPLGVTSWFDQEAIGTTNSSYFIEITFASSCYVSKANINTSRSNIKKQFPNSEAGMNESTSDIDLKISPNPVAGQLSIEVANKLVGADYCINDASGKIIFSGHVLSSNMNFDMSSFTNGTYYFSVNKSGVNMTKSFVKN